MSQKATFEVFMLQNNGGLIERGEFGNCNKELKRYLEQIEVERGTEFDTVLLEGC
jgi:hypothetical protein